jgi:hypothetical protein
MMFSITTTTFSVNMKVIAFLAALFATNGLVVAALITFPKCPSIELKCAPADVITKADGCAACKGGPGR